jgi:hypothetical protein
MQLYMELSIGESIDITWPKGNIFILSLSL